MQFKDLLPKHGNACTKHATTQPLSHYRGAHEGTDIRTALGKTFVVAFLLSLPQTALVSVFLAGPPAVQVYVATKK
ncbi:hypothetical protein E2C01_003992 [Portunus trituberculatus]|uniref:Uncharacterized protein n=1 Tax=Portunus trituberculatus TaxID=210409 RepID=A0A5B7CPF9_PORTR|nr:hypothetical protein [Portunus trituberculatus]